MINQLIANGLTAVMHYFFNIMLFITPPECKGTLANISSIIIMLSSFIYMTKIKLCPFGERTLAINILEMIIYVLLGELTLGIWKSIEYIVHLLVKAAFSSHIGSTTMTNFGNIVIVMVSVFILLTTIIETKIIQKNLQRRQNSSNSMSSQPNQINQAFKLKLEDNIRSHSDDLQIEKHRTPRVDFLQQRRRPQSRIGSIQQKLHEKSHHEGRTNDSHHYEDAFEQNQQPELFFRNPNCPCHGTEAQFRQSRLHRN